MSTPARIGVALACLAGGAATGVAATVLHHSVWGLPLGLVASFAAALALPGRWWARLPYGLAWALTVMGASVSRPEGDYLIGADGYGYTLLGAALLMVPLAIASLVRRGSSGEGERHPYP